MEKDLTIRRILAGGLAVAGAVISAAQRKFVFSYEVDVPPASAGTSVSHCWIPLPQSDEHQSISKLIVESRVAHKFGKNQEYSNGYAVFAPQPAEAAAGYDVTLRFEAPRREYMRDLRAAGGQAPPANQAMLKRYLEPEKMVPLNATIAELARTQTEGVTAPSRRPTRFITTWDRQCAMTNRAKAAVNADRVMFTCGRDIRLSAEQQDDPLNYFIYPYAEADGKAVNDEKTHFSFKDLAPPGAASRGN